MALNNKRLAIFAATVVNDVKIVEYTAAMDLETGRMNISERRGDCELLKEHRDIVREDRAEFENFAYSVQDDIKGMLDLGDTEVVEEEAPAEEAAE